MPWSRSQPAHSFGHGDDMWDDGCRRHSRHSRYFAAFPKPAVQIRERWEHWFACKGLEPRLGLGALERCAFRSLAMTAAPVAARIALEKLARAKSV